MSVHAYKMMSIKYDVLCNVFPPHFCDRPVYQIPARVVRKKSADRLISSSPLTPSSIEIHP